MNSPFSRYLFLFAFVILLASSCKNTDTTKDYSVPVNDPAVMELSGKIKADPDNAALFFERGSLLHRIQEDSLALLDYKKAVSLDSNKAEYYSAIGDLLFEHKDISGSVGWLEKAIKLNPKDPKAQLKIAKMFIFLNDYNKAFDAINTVLRQDVYNPEAYFLKGITYKNIKDTAKAISSFQTTINVLPDYREAHMQLGSLYSAKKDPKALQYYENAFRLDTTDVSPIYNTGLYYLNQNDLEGAKEQYKKAILKDKNYANAFFGMGFALMQQDSIEKAYRQFSIAVGIEPTNTDAYYNRGLCAEMLGRKAEAIADYEQALQFNPDYRPAADALKRLGVK
jgi:tetratricopeptide (TPR) repeat protein